MCFSGVHHLSVALKRPLCASMLDSSAQDVSVSHQSDQLAESLQGWSRSFTTHLLSMRQTAYNDCKMLHLCVFVTDSLQCSVYQRQCATPASVHSAFSRYQWRVLRWPPAYRFPHQPSCETHAFIRKLQIWWASCVLMALSLISDLDHAGGFWK